MKIKNILLILVVSVFLVGCGETKYITIVEKEAVNIPESFFNKPDTPEPPDRARYLSIKPEQREKALASYVIRLLNAIKDLHLIVDNIKEYNDKQKELVSKANKEK